MQSGRNGYLTVSWPGLVGSWLENGDDVCRGCASTRMNFATAYTRELRVASPDALLQFGNGALGSDFGGLSFRHDKIQLSRFN